MKCLWEGGNWSGRMLIWDPSVFGIVSVNCLSSQCLVSSSHDVVVVAAAQLHSTKPKLRFCTGSNSAHSMSR